MQSEMRTVLQTTDVESHLKNACKVVDRGGTFTGLQLFYGSKSGQGYV